MTLRWLARRLLAGALVTWAVLTATFILVHLAPGDPSRLLLDPRVPASRAVIQRAAWQLDRPLPEQYVGWLGRSLRGDLGQSFGTGRPVVRMLAEAVPASLALAVSATLLAVVLGLAIALVGALRPDGLADRAGGVLSLVLYAQPSFWLGLLLLLAAARFAPALAFPASTASAGAIPSWPAIVLPSIAVALVAAGQIARYARAGLAEAMSQELARSARARGLSHGATVLRHALPASAGPLLQIIALMLPLLASGTLAVEVVFSWPGLGRLTYLAAAGRDYPVVLAATALATVLTWTGTLLADVAQATVDPRVRLA